MNWEFIVEYLPLYEKATVLTVRIGLLGIAFAILVGFACAMVQYNRIPVVRQIVAVYIELSRKQDCSAGCHSYDKKRQICDSCKAGAQKQCARNSA